MNELQAVINHYEETRQRRGRAVLATVVKVAGSAYRRPGAKMLITEEGHTTGAISGGCLERDVVERASQVIKAGASRIIEYDTRGSEDIVWGLGLGCNGIVWVLLENLHDGSSAANAVQFMANCLRKHTTGVLATVIHSDKAAEGAGGPRSGAKEGAAGAEKLPSLAIGSRLMFDDLNHFDHIAPEHSPFINGDLLSRVREDAGHVLATGKLPGGATFRSYESGSDRTEIFFDVIAPPRDLVIVGAERDAEPVVHLARTLGWHITVVDIRARAASVERFGGADAVVLCRAHEIASQVPLTDHTAVVVMTHNYMDDAALLRVLLASEVSYVGILGPRERTSKLIEDLRSEDVSLSDVQLARLHYPIGVDIGAETQEEIALSILSEIKAVDAGRSGGFLRDRDAPIHDASIGDTSIQDTQVELILAK